VTLDQMEPGREGVIRKLDTRDKVGARLLVMGVCPGTMLRVVRNAPLKDPMEVEIDGYFISLRRSEARFVEVDPG